MKNRYKFRAWHTGQKRMFEVYGLGIDFITEETMDGVDAGNNVFFDDDLNFIKIMQSTSLKDKNGVDIYEGDIISYTQALFNAAQENYPKKVKVVEWNSLFGAWNIFETKAGEYDIEVIGNVYQQPELCINNG